MGLLRDWLSRLRATRRAARADYEPEVLLAGWVYLPPDFHTLSEAGSRQV